MVKAGFVACGNCNEGLVMTPMLRRYFDDKSTYRCPCCKRQYDVELLGTNMCPRCNVKMKHPKLWQYYCPRCEDVKKHGL